MAEAVVSMVIQGLRPLGDLMIQKAKFFNGVGDQVELAQNELVLMQGFLKDADVRLQDDLEVRKWVNIIRETAYDLEDAVESFVLKVAFKKEASVKVALERFACFLSRGCDRYKIGLEIKSITTKLSQLKLSVQSYDIKQDKGNEAATSSARQRERRLTYPHVIEHDVVGLGDDTEMLATHMVEDKGPRVVSIWGMGGSGKTTLAKQIYNHKKVRYHFDCFAWVCISQQCDGTSVMKEIFMKLSGVSDEQRQGIANLSNADIAEKLCNFQRSRKCLVVLDDIWTIDAWNSFKGGFSVNRKTESRILLTTRDRDVASLARGNRLLYESQPLSADESWNLFRKIAISDEMDDTNLQINSKKEELGQKMLQRCAGLPLAIIVLAGLLAGKDTVDEWESVNNNVDVYIRRGTYLEQEYNGQKYYGASWVLALSYDHLPYRLKPCFLYLGHFPEDHEISVKKLTRLWMAEGFISSTSDEMMEEVSYNCLNELVERCMVQVGEIGLTGKIKTCYLHDLMRDVCLLKAEEENFIHVVKHKHITSTSQAAADGKVRRVAIYLDKKVDNLVPTQNGHLRSLLYSAPKYFERKMSRRMIKPLFEDFKLLRVLRFEDMDGCKKLPTTIGNLVHLRFLSLKGSGVQQLPSSVANLVCLQTLDLRCLYHPKGMKIPNVFKRMKQLRHLYLPEEHSVIRKLSLAKACNLQTLVNVKGGDFDLNTLVELSILKKLYIMQTTWSSDWAKMEEALKSSTILRSLSLQLPGYHASLGILLRFRFIYKLQMEGPIRQLPQDLLSFPNLIKIKLISTKLMGDQIEILEKLPHLRVLYLQFHVFSRLPSKTLVCTNGGFPNLEFLSLQGLPEMKEWRVEEGAMPCLRKLCIDMCQELRAVPDGLQYVTTLKELTFKWMSQEFCSRIGEEGEDFHKIKHVPSRIIITGTDSSDRPRKRREAHMGGWCMPVCFK